MDLGLHLRVLWRFRVLMALGTLLALALATLTMARISFEGAKPALTYRESEQYLSAGRVQVTQEGFPEGRTTYPQNNRFADSGRFNQLAVYYSQFANSDEVQRRLYEQGPLNGTVLAQPASDPTDRGAVLPFIVFSGSAADPVTAQEAARRGIEAFTRFLNERQRAARIPDAERVRLKPVVEPPLGSLVSERKKTRSIATFLAVMTAFIALAFILENVRPRSSGVTAVDDRDELSASRRTA